MACLKHYAYGMKSKAYRNRFHYGSRFIDNDGLCVYCGVRATTLDHFVPLSVLYSVNDLGGINAERVTLEACRECNAIAGAKVFKTVAQKRMYIQARLREKNNTVLQTPQWKDEELSEMGYNMRTYIDASRQYRDWLEERLRWTNTKNPAVVEIAQVRSRLDVLGKSSALSNALISGTQKALGGLLKVNGKSFNG